MRSSTPVRERDRSVSSSTTVRRSRAGSGAADRWTGLLWTKGRRKRDEKRVGTEGLTWGCAGSSPLSLSFLPWFASSPLFAVFGVRRSLCFLETLAALAATLLKFHRRSIQAAILKSCKAAALCSSFIQFFWLSSTCVDENVRVFFIKKIPPLTSLSRWLSHCNPLRKRLFGVSLTY